MTQAQKAELEQRVRAEIAGRMVGEAIKEATAALRVSRRELAEATKGALTPGAIYRIEAGRGTPAELVAVRAALATLVATAEQKFQATVKGVHATIGELPETVPAEPAKATAPPAKATTTRK